MEGSCGPFTLYSPSYEVSSKEHVHAVQLIIYRQTAFPDKLTKSFESPSVTPELHPHQEIIFELWTMNILSCVPYILVTHRIETQNPQSSLNSISIATSIKNKPSVLRTEGVGDNIIFHEMKSLLKVIF